MKPTRLLTRLAAASALALALACPALAQPAPQPLRTTVVAKGLDNPWALAFLPDFAQTGRMLVTEKPGTMRIVGLDGKLSEPLKGLPEVVARGQGGLLDVTLHPRFKDNRLVYWSYSEAAPEGSANGTAVARGRLDEQAGALLDVQVVFRQQPKVDSRLHFGSRLVFDRDGRLFVTLGDRGSRRDAAQTLDNHLGKIVRLTDDGGVPPDNPFVGRAGARPEVWSYGHRNVQGAALHPSTGRLWADEHGPQGGDELNLPVKGANHGWPVITYGREYGTGLKIGEGTTREGIVAPLTHWVPSIAPSGLAFVTGDRHPAWKGQALIGAMKFGQLVRLELDGDRVLREHRHEVGDRVRDVRQGPDGHLYFLTDSGELRRIEPGG